MENDGLLHIVNGGLGIVVVQTGDVAQAFEKGLRAGDIFLLRFHQIGVKAAGFHGLLQNVPVIKRNAQLLGHPLANGVPTGAIFPADGNDFIHKSSPPLRAKAR